MRLKIIAGNLIAVLVSGLLAFYLVRAQLVSGLGAQVDEAIVGEQQLFAQTWKLTALEFVDQVRDRASTEAVVGAFAALDEDGRRRRAFEAAQAVAAWFQDPSRGRGGRPDIVAITDGAGKVIARDTDQNRMFGEVLTTSMPSLRRVLATGAAAHDAWRLGDENKVLRVAIAPIRSPEGTIIGGLVVGYDVTDTIATDAARLLGRDVAFLVEGRVYASSQTLSGAPAADLGRAITGPQRDALRAALAGATSSPLRLTLGDHERVGVLAQLPMMTAVPMAYAVLGDRTAAQELAGTANYILLLMGVALIIVIAYGFIVSNAILDPIEDIEEGVLAVINGRHDLRIEVEGEELGGLAYRVNQLINVFTGVSEGDEAGGSPPSGESWTGLESTVPGAGTMPAAPPPGGANDPVDDPAIAASLAAEPEDAYYARVFAEYVTAKQANGEDVSSIPQDKFVARLKGQAQSLATRHGVASVRFLVHAADGQVAMRPVLIR